MNKGALLTTNLLTENERLKLRYEASPLFNEDDWYELTHNRSRDELYNYLGLADQYSKVDADNLINNWHFNDMTVDQKMLKLSLDLGYVDDEKTSKHDIVTGYDDQGNEITETRELTDKQYYDYLMQNWLDYRNEEIKLEKRAIAKAEMSSWEKFWNTTGALFAEFGLGILDSVESLLNFTEAITAGTVMGIGEFSLSTGINEFYKYMTDDTLGLTPEFVDDLRADLHEWEMDNTYFMTVDGKTTTVGKYLAGAATSIGQQLPFWFMGPWGNIGFYATIFEQRVNQTADELGENSTVSPAFVLGEAFVESGAELLIELALSRIFGATSSDALRGITGAKRTLRGISRVAVDVLQEGVEEVLQELSSYFVSNVAGMIHDEYRTDITWGQCLDAFVTAAISSIITGGILETKNAYNFSRNSKALVEGDVNYHSLGVQTDGQIAKETKEQKIYRRAKLETALKANELLGHADDATVKVNNNSLGTNNKYGTINYETKQKYGLIGFIKSFKETMKGNNFSTKKGQKQAIDLTRQFYVGYKTMMDLFGEIGNERAVAAEKLLRDLETYASRTNNQIERARTLGKEIDFVTELSKQLDTISVDKLLNDAKKAKIKATAEELKKDGKLPENATVSKSTFQEFADLMDDESTSSDLAEKVQSTVDVLDKKYDLDFVPWDNWEIVERNRVIFAPVDAAKNLTPEQIVKCAAEREMVVEYGKALPDAVLDHFVKRFTEYYGDSEGNVTFKAITALLFDSNFYNYLLNCSDESAFNILKTVDATLKVIVEKSDSDTMKQQYAETAKKIRHVIGPALVMYFCNNPNAKLENVTVFNQSHLDFIKQHRYNYLLARRAIKGIATKQEYNVIRNRINNSTIDGDTKSKWNDIISLQSKSKTVSYAVERLLIKLDEYYDGIFFGKYNNVYFLKGTDVKSARFNGFLKQINSSVYKIMLGIAPDNVNVNDVRQYYIEQFERFTDDKYTFKITDNRDNPIEIIEKSIDYNTYTNMAYLPSVNKTAEDGNYPFSETPTITKYLTDYLNDTIDDVELTYLSLDEVLERPEKYLEDSVIKDIRDNYGVVNKATAFMQLSDLVLYKSNNQIALILDNDGEVLAVEFKNAVDVVAPKLRNKFNNDTSLYDSIVKNGCEISDFIRKELLVGTLSDIKITVSKDTRGTTKGVYSPITNTITLYLSKPRTNGQIIETILHEFNHAVQYYNNFGMGAFDVIPISDDMMADIERHVPELFEDVSNKKRFETARYWIYSNATGEQLSNGKYLQQYGHYPVICITEKTVNDANRLRRIDTIIMPWGTKYVINDSDTAEIVSQKEPPKGYKHKILDAKDSKKTSKNSEPPKKSRKSLLKDIPKTMSLDESLRQAKEYQQRIKDAQAVIKVKRDSGEEVSYKDIEPFQRDRKNNIFIFSDDVIAKLLDGKYVQKDDETYRRSEAVIKSARDKGIRDSHKSHKESGMYSERGRAIFAKNAKGTNLEYWLKLHPNKTPKVAPAIQEFVISADNFDKLDPFFVERIKNADLLLWDVWDYIRTNEPNQYTFDELKKAFFKNTPFNTFAEVKKFVSLTELAYGIKAGFLKNEEFTELIHKEIKGSVDSVADKLKKMSKDPMISDTVNKTIKGFSEAWVTDKHGKRYKAELNMENASADIILGLLWYFDRTINSLAYIAGNAKYALIASESEGLPFTFKLKQDLAGQSKKRRLSFESNVSGKGGDDSSHTYADKIADAKVNVEDETSESIRFAIVELAQDYLALLRREGRMDEAKELGAMLMKDFEDLSDADLATRLATLRVLMEEGYAFDEAYRKDMSEIMTAVVDPDTVLEFDGKTVDKLDDDFERDDDGNIINRDSVYDSVYKIIDRLGKKHMSGTIYQNLPEEFKQYFDPANGFKLRKGSLNKLSNKQLYDLRNNLKDLGARIRTGEFLNAKAKSTSMAIEKQLTKTKAKLAEVEAQLKQSKTKTVKSTSNGKLVYDTAIIEDVNIRSDIPVPEKLSELLNTTFTKSRESTKQFSRIDNPTYLQASMKEFFEQNGETLNNLTGQDAEEILTFFETATIPGREYTPYDAMRVYILAYFIQQVDENNLDVDAKFMDRAQQLLHGIVTNSAAQTLAAWKSVMHKVDPDAVLLKNLSTTFDIELDDDDVKPLGQVLRRLGSPRFEYREGTDANGKHGTIAVERAMTAEELAVIVKTLNQVMNDLRHKILEKLRARVEAEHLTKAQREELYRLTRKKELGQRLTEVEESYYAKLSVAMNKVKYLTIGGKTIKVKGKGIPLRSRKVIYDMLLKWQRTAMLSAPATAVRNKFVNVILGGIDVKGHHIWGLNDVADWIGNLKIWNGASKVFNFGKNRAAFENQYNMIGVKVSTETMKFIDEMLLKTDFLSIVQNGLTKYDTRTKNAKSDNVELQVQDMIVYGLKETLLGNYTFTKNKNKNAKYNKFKQFIGKKMYGEHDADLINEFGVMDNIAKAVFTMQSDDKNVKATALRYIGKLLESQHVDLSKGLTPQVLQIVADAWVFASYEYMHRNNFIMDLEHMLRNKYPDIHFVLKSVMPFLGSRWNWFLEILQMNPVSLLYNIRQLNNLENYIAKLDDRRAKGDMTAPSSKFAEIIVRRKIGKGVVGTVLFGLGMLLRYFGKIQVDEEDNKYKLRIGDTWIDISEVFGSSSLFIGAAFVRTGEKYSDTYAQEEWDFMKVLKDAANEMLNDGMMSQFMDMTKYDDTPADYLSSLPSTWVNSFVPNVWKSAVKLTNNHKVKYSSGFLGNLQFLAMQSIPFFEYAMPKAIDPYTGEWEARYSVPVIHQLVSFAGSPISFKTYDITDVESEFLWLEINKKMLTGKYDDVGQLDKIKLNQFYGKMNKRTLDECLNNKTKYKVLNKTTNKYENLYYKDMSNEQKKSVLNRITNQNAKYAKIYVWTGDGHKYYCTNDERLELMRIGITKNVYIKSGKKDGFVP